MRSATRGLDARVLAPRARVHRLRGAALARPRRASPTSSTAAASCARQFAERVARLPGCELLNDVVINQVLFRFGDDETTNAVLARRAGERRGVDGRDDVGRAAGDPRLGLELAHDRGDIDRTVAAFERALARV